MKFPKPKTIKPKAGELPSSGRKAAKMALPKADKKGTPDFQRNARSYFKNKPKGLAKARGKKV